MTKRTGSINKHGAELQGQCLYCYGMLLTHCCWVLLAECACKAGHPGLIPGSGRSPGEGNVNPLQYSCLENPMDRGALQATVHGVTIVGHDLVTKPPPIHCSWEHPTGVNCLDDRCWKERKLLAKIPFWENNRMVNTKIRLIIFFAAKDGETLYSQQKQDQELTVSQINSLLPNSDFIEESRENH